MKYLHEYRDNTLIKALVKAIHSQLTRPWVLMEVCGGQTHNIVKYALDQLLPPELQLVHGPGCPVCVTAPEIIDQAIQVAQRSDIIFCTFGDMLRVPGSEQSLQFAKIQGADVRMVYSPLDAISIAHNNPSKHVVFFAVGFETTAPATAMALWTAKRNGISNFSVLLSHFLVPPAISAIAEDRENRVQGFLAPGHVCAITGLEAYTALSQTYRMPMVITGFEPVDILQGILRCVTQLERGEASTDNQYRRVVADKGNTAAQQIMDAVFQTSDQAWRGIGIIKNSGLQLSNDYHQYDATALTHSASSRSPANIPVQQSCISGDILRGLKKPPQCPHFGKSCRPEHPLGAPMVSSEGACAAYFHYQ